MPAQISRMPAATCARRQLAQEHDAEHRDDQRRRAAHQRIGERQVAGAVRVRERDVVARNGWPTTRRRTSTRPDRAAARTAAAASAHTDEPATTDAVSSIGSPPGALFSSAFQPACSNPAPSTASVMPSDSSCAGITLQPRRSARSAAHAASCIGLPVRQRPLRGFEDGDEVGERRRRRAGDFGEVVPQPHAAPRPRRTAAR